MSLKFGRKNTVPGVSSKMLNKTFNVQGTDSLFIAPSLNELKLNITEATGKKGENIFDYPIKNTILQMQNSQGENILGSFKYAIVNKGDIKEKK